MTTRAFAFANLIGGDNKISLGALPDEATGGGDALGTVTGSNLDLSTGNFFEVTANDQTLSFSNSPDVHGFSIKVTGSGSFTFYGLSGATYDSVSFSLDSQDSSPSGIDFSPDGTKMYIVGFISDAVHQYTLSTGFDLSTASYDNVTFSVAAQDITPLDIFISPNGTKMYIVGATSDSVHQYTLSTGFDLSTVSYDNVTFSVAAQDTAPQGLTFNPSGTKMYMAGAGTDTVHQYTLSTGFDLSTASYDSIGFNVSGQENVARAIAFNPDGTKMYIVGTGTDAVHQYTLSTGFDLSTASYDSISFNVSAQQDIPQGMAFSDLNDKFFIVGQSPSSVFQYTTGENLQKTITYPASVRFSGSITPTDPAVGEVDILEFVTFDGGTTYYAYQLGDNHG